MPSKRVHPSRRRRDRAAARMLRAATWGRTDQVSPASPNDLEDHRVERKIRHATATPGMPAAPRPFVGTAPAREQLPDGRVVAAPSPFAARPLAGRRPRKPRAYGARTARPYRASYGPRVVRAAAVPQAQRFGSRAV